MKQREFKEINETKRKAILAGVIAKKTGYRLPNNLIGEIIKSLDIDNQYKIEVFNTADEFAGHCRLKRYIYEGRYNNDPVDMGGRTEKASVILGEVQFGEDIKDEWKEVTRKTDPNFDVDKIHAVIVESKWDYSPLVGDYEYSLDRMLIVYVPSEEPINLSDEMRKFIEELGLGDEIK